MRVRGLAGELAAFAFFLSLALVATRPLAATLGEGTLAGPDPLIDLWTVHWLSGHLLPPREVFGGNVFHPDPNPVLYSDLSLGTAVLLLPLRTVVRDPLALYNAALLVALAFSGWAFHALVRDRTGSRWAGLLSGTLAAFASHQLYHVYHLNLLSTGWLALLLLALHRLRERPGPGPALLAALSFALCAQSSGYYAVAAALLPLLFAAWHARSLVASRRALAACAASAVLGALLLAPYLHAFLAVREREDLRRPQGLSQRMAFSPARDLSSHGYLYRGLLGSEGERLFPGLLSLGLAGVALARRRPGAAFYAAGAGLLLLVSLGPELELGGARIGLPYKWLFAIPPLDNMRHPYTFAAVATFLLAVLAGFGYAALGLASRPWAGPLAVALAIAETLAPPPQLQRYAPGLPPVYALLAAQPPGAVLEVPVSAPETLLWAARHGRSTANGIGAFSPRRSAQLERWIQNHWLARTPEDVDASPPTWLIARELDVRYVILPTGRKPATRKLARAFEASRVFTLIAAADDGDRLYAVHPERVAEEPRPEAP